MSLTGRRIIERVKGSFGGLIRLPSPPYGKPAYWNSVYCSCQPTDVFEWGHLTLAEDFFNYEYQLLPTTRSTTSSANAFNKATMATTFAETIGVRPNDNNQPVMILGCGYSRLGEDMNKNGWKRIVQIDIFPKVIQDLSKRCASSDCSEIEFIESDAASLSAFDSGSMHAVVDKGLVDALHLVDEQTQVRDIMRSAHRVLKPNGIFCIFSMSEPSYLFSTLMEVTDDLRDDQRRTWKSVQVRQLKKVFLYRFQRARADDVENITKTSRALKKLTRR